MSVCLCARLAPYLPELLTSLQQKYVFLEPLCKKKGDANSEGEQLTQVYVAATWWNCKWMPGCIQGRETGVLFPYAIYVNEGSASPVFSFLPLPPSLCLVLPPPLGVTRKRKGRRGNAPRVSPHIQWKLFLVVHWQWFLSKRQQH